MKRIDKEELYQHLSGFLKSKGIELTEGNYAVGIKKSCFFLADAINLSQQGIERARTEVNKNVDKLRQVIHEKTAPKGATPKASGPAPATPPPRASAGQAKGASSKASPRKKAKRAKAA